MILSGISTLVCACLCSSAIRFENMTRARLLGTCHAAQTPFLAAFVLALNSADDSSDSQLVVHEQCLTSPSPRYTQLGLSSAQPVELIAHDVSLCPAPARSTCPHCVACHRARLQQPLTRAWCVAGRVCKFLSTVIVCVGHGETT